MFGKSWKLFKLFGFEIKIDPSWLILAVKDMLKFLSLKMELEETQKERRQIK
jgi:hypothetical protein